MTNTSVTISRPQAVFLVLLPAMVLFSRALSDAVASLCTLGLVWMWFARPETRWFRAPWFGGVLLLWLFMLLVTSPLAMDPVYSFRESFIFIRWPMFALCLCLVFFRTGRGLQLFERAALGLFLFIVLDSLFQYTTGYDIFGRTSTWDVRLTGPFSKNVPGIYALRLYPIAVVALLGATGAGKRTTSLLLLATMVLAQVFAFLTGERIVFLLFGMINAALLVATLYVLRPPRLWVAGGAVAAAAMGVATTLLVPRMFDRTIESFARQVGDFQHTDYYKIFEAAILLWQKHPLAGIGTRYFSAGCEQFNYVAYHHGCAVHPHNIYLEWLSQNGVIGLLLFMLVLVLIFRQLWNELDFRRRTLVSVAVFMAPVSIFWPLMSSMSMLSNNYAGEVWLVVAWSLMRARHGTAAAGAA